MSTYAFVFTGQGSQQVGMLGQLAKEFSEITETFAIASEVLGFDLWKLCQEGPEERLNQTQFTQPALLTAGVAMWNIWQKMDLPLPAFLAGHSLGEYTALVCARAVDFPSAVSLVALRGKYMQEAVPPGQGAMAAIIGLDDQAVSQICYLISQQNGNVSPANFNSTEQVVVAGDKHAVEQAVQLAKEQGAKLAKLLPVSVPSHCGLMKPAAEKLALKLETVSFKAPEIPIVNNVDVACYDQPMALRDALIRQLYCPVRWVEIVQFFASRSISMIVESGPGRVLTGLNKRIDDTIQSLTLDQIDAFPKVLSMMGEERWV
jgi:[acyl-carrier-protein] S-malonyltransferase